jgi:hypothetical protein
MSKGYNAFEPDDLALAQSVLDEVWSSLPSEVRNGSRAALLRERLARQVLSAMNNESLGRNELKVSLLRTHIEDWT